jgi:hypothetical protein
VTAVTCPAGMPAGPAALTMVPPELIETTERSSPAMAIPSGITYTPAAGRAFRHTHAAEVSRRPVKPRRRPRRG